MDGVKKIANEIWENLPVWFIYYTIVLTVIGDIAYLKEPRYDFVITFIFPYSIFLLYYFTHLKGCEDISKMGRFRYFLLLTGITLAPIIIVILTAGPVRLGNGWQSHLDAYITYFEISNIFWTLLLASHCYRFRDWKGLLLFFGAAFLYGMILESGGITMGYFFEDNYHLYLPGFSAPVATMFGWSTIFYPSVFILDKIRKGYLSIQSRSFIWLAFFTAVIACFFDLMIDPFATNIGLWEWNEIYNPGNNFYWFGVPLINFVSWFSAVFSFGCFYYFFEIKKAGWDQMKRSIAMLVSLPCILLTAGIIEFSSLGIIEGLDGPSWKILKEYISAGMPLKREPRRKVKN